MKYVKRKAKTKTDDKIKNVRGQLDDDEPADAPEDRVDDGREISDDELKHDALKVKQRKGSRRRDASKGEVDADDFFEDVDIADGKSTFYEMNLSRPLMKAVGELNFIYTTPIQSATIPVALLGMFLTTRLFPRA